MQFEFNELAPGRFAMSELGKSEPSRRTPETKERVVKPTTDVSINWLKKLSTKSKIMITLGVLLAGYFSFAFYLGPGSEPGPDPIFTVIDEFDDQIYPVASNSEVQEIYIFFVASWCSVSKEFIEKELAPISKSFGVGTDRPKIVLIFSRSEWNEMELKAHALASSSEEAELLVQDAKSNAQQIDPELAERFFNPQWILENVLPTNMYIARVGNAKELNKKISSGDLPEGALPENVPSYYDPASGKWYSKGSPKWSEYMAKLKDKT